MIAVAQAGFWLRVVTVGAIAGAVLVAAGQLMLVAGIIDLARRTIIWLS